MNVTVLRLSPSIIQLECSGCGASAKASCDCALPYVPAGARAAAAVAASPKKSDRAIAAEIGVSHPTVAKARATGKQLPVEARTGKDGKTRRLPSPRAVLAAALRAMENDPEPGIEDELDEDPANFRTAYLLRVEQAIRFAVYARGPVTKELANDARRVAAAWTTLAIKLESAM